MTYVNVMVAAVPTDRRADYWQGAKQMGNAFRRHGALEIVECWGDDVPDGKVTSFPMAVNCAPDETVVVSWITWPDKATAVNAMAKVGNEPEMQMGDEPPLFDMGRMIHGGFEIMSDG